MIRVQLEERTAESGTRTVVAALIVEDDGTYRFEGDREEFPTYLHALTVDEHDELQMVEFDQDPATWARNLDTVLHSGYVVPVITHDDAAAAAEERS